MHVSVRASHGHAAHTHASQGLRKPSAAAYEAVISHLQLPADQLIFVDDRQVNVDGAASSGMTALRFTGADVLESQLRDLGLQF